MGTTTNLIQHTTEFALHLVQAYVRPGDIVIDATCGNGHDTLRLAQMLQLPKAGSSARISDAARRAPTGIAAAGSPGPISLREIVGRSPATTAALQRVAVDCSLRGDSSVGASLPEAAPSEADPAGTAAAEAAAAETSFTEAAPSGHLFAFDIQPEAIRATGELLTRNGFDPASITLTCLGHEHMREYFRTHIPGILSGAAAAADEAPAEAAASAVDAAGDGFAAAIVFNLGYLPGGDKELTTRTETTLTAAGDALSLLRRDGLLCITMYSGHPEGAEEKRALLAFAEGLDSRRWHVSYINMLNQKHSADGVPAAGSAGAQRRSKNPPEILLITRKR